MTDALWPVAAAVACVLAWDGWRRWLVRQRADHAQRLDAVELAQRALAAESRKLSGAGQTHEERIADLAARVGRLESDSGEIKRMATNVSSALVNGGVRNRIRR